jgi:hypothetical protein
MTKKTLAITILVLIAAFAWYRFVYKPKMQPDPTIPTIAFAESRAYCFGRVQEATKDAPYRVEEHMKLTRVRGEITGTKSGTQSGPDMTNGFTGTMTGEAKDGYLQFTYAYTIDGSKQKELEVYLIQGLDLVKQRYTLDDAVKDGEHILVPNLTSTPTLITYTSEPCR